MTPSSDVAILLCCSEAAIEGSCAAQITWCGSVSLQFVPATLGGSSRCVRAIADIGSRVMATLTGFAVATQQNMLEVRGPAKGINNGGIRPHIALVSSSTHISLLQPRPVLFLLHAHLLHHRNSPQHAHFDQHCSAPALCARPRGCSPSGCKHPRATRREQQHASQEARRRSLSHARARPILCSS